MKSPFLVVLVFVGVFLCGGVVGGAVSIHYYERFVRDRGADRFIVREMRELNERLGLSADQKKELRVIFSRSMEDQRAARKQIDTVIERLRADFETVLTPEQRTKFKDYRAQQRAAREQRERERRKRPDDGGPPLPPFLERKERERGPGASNPGPTTPDASADPRER